MNGIHPYADYKCHQYVIDACAKVSTRFDCLEKTAKISYRIIDIAAILKEGCSAPFALLSSQIKDLVLCIESTRFFTTAPPLIFRDNKGQFFFQTNPKLKSAERISIVFHTALKAIQGAERVGLIRLGTIATYALGHVPIFRWMIEGTIWMFYFFGAWDSTREIRDLQKTSIIARHKINKYQQSPQTLPEVLHAFSDRNIKNKCQKLEKWKIVKVNLHIDLTKAWMKIAANVSKLILITLALTFAVMCMETMPCQLTLLTLGTFSDLIGLTRIFYIEYSHL